MISLLDGRLRKWLLGLALSARKASDAAVLRLAIVEEKNDGGKEKETNTGKTARLDGPPEHWVRLVQRHAPELLQPGPPHFVSQAQTRLFERHVDANASEKNEFLQIRQGDEGPIDSGTRPESAFSSKSFRSSEKPDTPPSPELKRTESGFAGDSETAAKARENFIRDDTSVPPSTNQSGSDGNSQSLESKTKIKKEVRPSFANPEGKSETAARGTLAAKHMKTQKPVSFAIFSFSSAGNVEDSRTDITRGKTIRRDPTENFRVAKGTVEYKTESDTQDNSPGPLFEFDTETRDFSSVKKKNAYETNSGSSNILKPEKVSPSGTIENSTPQVKAKAKKNGNDYKQFEQIRMNNGELRARTFEKRESIDGNRSKTDQLRWPGLPGENGSEDLSDAALAGRWPSLPEEKTVGVQPVERQISPEMLEKELREAERLRRLDEEQKGTAWNGSCF